MLIRIKHTSRYGLKRHVYQSILHRNQSDLFDWPYSQSGITIAHTPPSSIYTDKTFYDKVEKEITFRQQWLCIGRTSQVPLAGDYISGTILDNPFVVVNNGQGVYKAYSNVCRHHAALLCDDNTTGSLPPVYTNPSSPPSYRLSCPYHGWQYSTSSGTLTKAIKMKGCKDFIASKITLPKYDVDTVGPWIFLRLNAPSNSCERIIDDQPDIKEYLNLLEASDYNKDMVHVKHSKYHIKCNWKVFIDNYLDGGYHVPIAHPKLSAGLDMSTYDRTRFQNIFIQTCKSRQDDVNNSRLNAKDYPALYIYHYPNLCINRYGDWMDTNIVWPVNERECVVYFDWYVHQSYCTIDKQTIISQSLNDSHIVQLEDIMLSERVQRGLNSECYQAGRYAPELEDGEYFFHQRLYRDYLLAINHVNK